MEDKIMKSLKDNPKELFKLQADKNFPIFKRGDIILTNHRTSWIAKQIRKLTREAGEGFSLVNHALIYISDGRGIEAGSWRIYFCKIKKYFTGNHEVYIMRKIGLTDAERNEKVWEAIKYLNRTYGYLQIAGLAIYNKTGWRWAKKIKTPFGMICSGLVGQVYFDRQDMSPDCIMDYAIENSAIWELIRVV
jgi:cell wall-associated NlpC family hydrolase